MLKTKLGIILSVLILLVIPSIESELTPPSLSDKEIIDFDGKVKFGGIESTSNLNKTIELTKDKFGKIEEIKIILREEVIIPEQNITADKDGMPIDNGYYNVTTGYNMIIYQPTVSKYNSINLLKEIEIKDIMSDGGEICQVTYATEFVPELRSKECG